MPPDPKPPWKFKKGRTVTPEEFNAVFDAFRVSAFRLETLQQYAISAEDAALRAFREGTPRPERSVRTSPWMRRIAATTMAGKSWSRVRLVRHPPTEYVRYELISYVESVVVGEEIRLVDLNAHPVLGDLGPDFWLFDAGEPDELAIVMRYGADGSAPSYERTTDVAWCRNQRDTALSRSVSLAEYLAQQSTR